MHLSPQRSLALFLTAASGAYAAAILLAEHWLGFFHVPVHDEVHYMAAIRNFAQHGLSPSSLASYNELSGPLPFIMYAAWGKVFGFGMPALRVLSLIIAALTLAAMHRALLLHFRSAKMALGASLLLAANPYMAALSVLVYTDMPALLFFFTALVCLRQGKPWAYGAAMAMALLCRQHLIFFPMAAGLASLAGWAGGRWREAPAAAASTLACILPLGALMIHWGGACPPGLARQAWVEGSSGFHGDFLTLYAAWLFVYLWPAVLFKARQVYRPWMLGLAAALWPWCLAFPAGPSPSALRNGLVFTGFFHRALAWTPLTEGGVRLILHACFFLGLPVVFFFVRRLVHAIRTRDFGPGVIPSLSVLIFLAVMPFSHLAWEKYMLPILPLALAGLWEGGFHQNKEFP